MATSPDQTSPGGFPLPVHVAMWQRRFEKAPDSLGQGVRTDGQPVGLLLALTKAN